MNSNKSKEEAEEELEKHKAQLSEYKTRHEEETVLRLHFEGKLNKIHSFQRDTEEKYHRALEDIDYYIERNKEQANLLNKINSEHQKLRNENINIESLLNSKDAVISGLQEKINSNKDLVDQMNKIISEKSTEITRLNHDYLRQKSLTIEAETMVFTLKSQVNSFKKLKEVSEHDTSTVKARLDLRDTEIERLKDKIDKFKHNNNELNQEKLGFEVYKEIMSKQIDDLNDDRMNLTKTIHELEVENTSIKQLLQNSEEEGDQYYAVNEELAIKIHEANQEVNRMIMENEDKVEKIRLLQENIEEIKEKLNVSNHRLETAQHKISLLEGENDSILIKLKSQESTYSKQKALLLK